jgi:hypothetical protein
VSRGSGAQVSRRIGRGSARLRRRQHALLSLAILFGAGGVFALAGRDDKERAVTTPAQIPSGTELRVRLEERLSTRRNCKGDVFYLEILEDVKIPNGLAIPRSTQVMGRLQHVKRAGRIYGKAEMKFEFEAFQFRNGVRVPIQAELVSLNASPAKAKTSKDSGSLETSGDRKRDAQVVGGTSGIGALIGSIKGGARGALIGAGAGAAIGLGGVLGGRGRDLELEPETQMVLRLVKPLDLPVDVLTSAP